MATSRAPCQSCSLPFYTDENDLCPYCGQVAPDGGVTDDSPAPASARSRATCDTCGLAYYADENDACPYCARAEAATATPHGDGAVDRDDSDDTETADATETEPDRETESDREPVDDPEATETAATGDDESEETSDDERPSSFLGKLLRPLQKLFGG